jgi:MFS family permease
VLEVPSGVWADAYSRRLLLALAPLLSGAGFALWVLAPSYPAFAAGFVLWGAQGALQSGALEALVYEELERERATARYAHVIGRATALGTVASALAMGLAAPVLAVGGFAALGAASVAVCLAAAAVGASFPEHRPRGTAAGTGVRPFVATLRAGAHEVRTRPAVRAAVLMVPLVAAIWGSLDEYLPLLAVEAGATLAAVPLLGLLVYTGVASGALLAGRARRLRSSALAALLAGAAAALAAGALAGSAWGFVLIAVAFCGLQAVTVVVDVRLQDAIDGEARATVTSLAGLGTEVLVIATFAAYAAGSTVADHATLFAVFAAAHLLVAAALARLRA